MDAERGLPDNPASRRASVPAGEEQRGSQRGHVLPQRAGRSDLTPASSLGGSAEAAGGQPHVLPQAECSCSAIFQGSEATPPLEMKCTLNEQAKNYPAKNRRCPDDSPVCTALPLNIISLLVSYRLTS